MYRAIRRLGQLADELERFRTLAPADTGDDDRAA
jgi:hypothetical protein